LDSLLLNSLHLPFTQSIVYNKTCTEQSTAQLLKIKNAVTESFRIWYPVLPNRWSHVITNGYVDVHMLVLSWKIQKWC